MWLHEYAGCALGSLGVDVGAKKKVFFSMGTLLCFSVRSWGRRGGERHL
uniref:Uncharacterized protein n=1 Tax=Anguilla anguilla TaxID=7936 RepID=A0A0E9QNA9_ANGAN